MCCNICYHQNVNKHTVLFHVLQHMLPSKCEQTRRPHHVLQYTLLFKIVAPPVWSDGRTAPLWGEVVAR